MDKLYHIGVSSPDLLAGNSTSLRQLFRDSSCQPLSPARSREILEAELATGHERLPLEQCGDWDWKIGYQGQPVKSEVTKA